MYRSTYVPIKIRVLHLISFWLHWAGFISSLLSSGALFIVESSVTYGFFFAWITQAPQWPFPLSLSGNAGNDQSGLQDQDPKGCYVAPVYETKQYARPSQFIVAS